jgi:hypothetical protein
MIPSKKIARVLEEDNRHPVVKSERSLCRPSLVHRAHQQFMNASVKVCWLAEMSRNLHAKADRWERIHAE